MLSLLLCAGMASAQTPANMTVLQGNGQLICTFCVGPTGSFNFQSMVVRVTDANGNPVPNATVNWLVTGGDFSGALRNQTTVTDFNGLTYNNYDAGFNISVGTPAQAFVQTTVVASSGNAAATFTLTQGLQANAALTGGIGFPPITVRAVTSLFNGTVFSGQVGTTGTPIKIQVVSSLLNDPVPNVSVMLVNDQPASSGPTILCATQSGAGTDTVLTDATGTATCNPIFGGVPGVTGTAYVSVGGSYPLEHFSDPTQQPTPFVVFPGGDTGRLVVRVTPGIPGALRLISGNSQTAQAGQALSAALVVEVDSTAGAGLAGLPINWRVSPAGAATLSSSTTTTGSNGQTSNTLRFASTASGTVQVIASLATDASKTFTFNVTAIPNITVTGLTAISGTGQSTIVNTPFGSPLVVQLNATGGSAAGIPVQFSINGPGTLSATVVNTDAAGQAQVTVRATGTPGAVTVTASANGFTANFNLTVSPPGPSLTAGSFMNAADFQFGALSPCSLATIIAPGLAPGLQGMVSAGFIGPLPYLLANDKVGVGGSAAPIVSVGLNGNGREQLTFQVPCDVTPGSSVPVAVGVGSGSATINIPIQAASPGVFQTIMTDGKSRAVILRPDGSFVSLANPARRGENVIAFATGLGPANPPVGTNSVAAPGAIVAPQGIVVTGMAGGGVPLVTTQLSYDVVGLWLVTFTIPVDMQTGTDVPFSISVIPAGASSPITSSTTNIPVQ